MIKDNPLLINQNNNIVLINHLFISTNLLHSVLDLQINIINFILITKKRNLHKPDLIKEPGNKDKALGINRIKKIKINLHNSKIHIIIHPTVRRSIKKQIIIVAFNKPINKINQNNQIFSNPKNLHINRHKIKNTNKYVEPINERRIYKNKNKKREKILKSFSFC